MNRPRVLITGSAGQLGSEISRRIRETHEVVGMDLLQSPWTTCLGSIVDRTLVRRALRGVDCVIHTASLHAPPIEAFTRDIFVDVNIKAFLHLLETAVEEGVRRIIYTSSTCVYGYALEAQDKAVWVTETLPARPRDIYDITTIAAEELCRDVVRTSSLDVTVIRASRFHPEEPRVFASDRLYRGVDVRDAAAAHVRALSADIKGFNLFLVSAKSPFAPSDARALLVDAPSVIRRYFPRAEDAFRRRGWALPRSVDRVYDTTAAEIALGYESRFGFEAVLEGS